MRIKLFRFFFYTPREIYAVFLSFFFLVFAEFVIRFSDSKSLLKSLQTVNEKKNRFWFFAVPLHKLRRTRLVSLVEAVDRNFIWKPLCLRRSVALGYLSRALGFFPKLKIGAQLEQGILRAHSWLEADGLRLEMDDESAAYMVLSPSDQEP